MMKAYSISRFLTTVLLFCLVIASCSRSPYRYVKVTPEPFPDKEQVRTGEQTRSQASEEELTASADDQQEPNIDPQAEQEAGGADEAEPVSEEVVSVRVDREAVAAIAPQPRKAEKPASKTTRTVVHRGSQKTAAFSAPPVKKQQRLEKNISRKVERVAKKSASSSSSSASIFFNQWMKIGLILIVVGLVVGIIWGALGWVVTVIGLVFFILGLIQQM